MDESTTQYTSYDEFKQLKFENMRLLSQLIKVNISIYELRLIKEKLLHYK